MGEAGSARQFADWAPSSIAPGQRVSVAIKQSPRARPGVDHRFDGADVRFEIAPNGSERIDRGDHRTGEFMASGTHGP